MNEKCQHDAEASGSAHRTVSACRMPLSVSKAAINLWSGWLLFCCFLNSSSTKKITFLKKTIIQKMKFCVNVHMRILPHMLKKGFGEIPQQAATGRPVAMLAIPGNAVLRGACFSLLRQAAQNTKVPSGTIFWRRTVWHYLGQCAIILLARIEQVSFEFVYYK